MLTIISPAKTLDFETPPATQQFSNSDFLDDSEKIIWELRKMSVGEIASFMDISIKLAEVNFERFLLWQKTLTIENAKQALLAFKGDVYVGLDAESFTEDDFVVAQKSLRILSGLYGVLKPLDLILPYRLEMGIKLKIENTNNLYDYWSDKITENLNSAISTGNHEALINLASAEYFKVINSKNICRPIITPIFKEEKNNKYQVVAIHAKKARGLMTRFILKNKLTNVNDIKAFDEAGYIFRETMSNEHDWTFTRIS